MLLSLNLSLYKMFDKPTYFSFYYKKFGDSKNILDWPMKVVEKRQRGNLMGDYEGEVMNGKGLDKIIQ